MSVIDWARVITHVVGCVALMVTSGLIVRGVLTVASKPSPAIDPKAVRAGVVIGKCENVLIFIFMLLEAYTALALVFTAKSIIRKEDFQKSPEYYLLGTMVNVTYSVCMGLFFRWLPSTY
jgi:hypothetical protein